MLVREVLGHDQRGDEVDRLAVVCAEVDRMREPDERRARFTDCCAASMRNRDAVPKTGRAQLLARFERRVHDARVVLAGEQVGEPRDQRRLVVRDEIRPHPLGGQQVEKWHERKGLSGSLDGGGRLMVLAFDGSWAQRRLPLTASWEACATRRRSSGSSRESGNHFSIAQGGAGSRLFAGTDAAHAFDDSIPDQL